MHFKVKGGVSCVRTMQSPQPSVRVRAFVASPSKRGCGIAYSLQRRQYCQSSSRRQPGWFSQTMADLENSLHAAKFSNLGLDSKYTMYPLSQIRLLSVDTKHNRLISITLVTLWYFSYWDFRCPRMARYVAREGKIDNQINGTVPEREGGVAVDAEVNAPLPAPHHRIRP